jgi:hypothetical protein
MFRRLGRNDSTDSEESDLHGLLDYGRLHVDLLREHLQQVEALESEVLPFILRLLAQSVVDYADEGLVDLGVGKAPLPELRVVGPLSDASAE